MNTVIMKYSLFPVLAVLLTACSTVDSEKVTSVDGQYITRVVQDISTDEFLGRKPFTEGETKTVSYLENELKSLGVEPGNGDSYRQSVPLVAISPTPDETMLLKGHGQNIDLKLKDDFVAYSEQEEEDLVVEESEVIFCGFGITAPEYEWNDFEGMDVEGKTIVVLVNDPGFGSDNEDFFKGNTMTYYGRWTYKYEEAARQGAAAVLIVHETTSAGYPWFVVENSWSGTKLNLRTENGNRDKAAIQGWITLDVAQDLFEKAGFDLGAEIRKARTTDFKPFSLGYTMDYHLSNSFEYDQSDNVVGLIPGKSRPDEYIIYSSHWDHLGVGQVVDGDSIYNGAVDNASGVACMLSIAKAMKESPALDRSIVFLFVTAEEQGLLGSQYYGENPIYPVDMTVANLNMDAMNIFGPMKYLTLTGMGHSDMDNYARDAAAKQGREVLANPEPEKGYFFRSDHFNFAKVGIPALYAEGDVEHIEKGREFVSEMKEDHLSNYYHQPADEYDANRWDVSGLVQDSDLYLDIGSRLANESTWPEWKDGSEFKAAREASRLKN